MRPKTCQAHIARERCITTGPNCRWFDSPAWTGRGGSCRHDPWWDLETDEEATAETLENVAMDMVLEEIRALKLNIADGFKRYAMETAMAADASWRRPRFENVQPKVEFSAEVEGTSKSGKRISAKVARLFEEKG